jgi:hypothetical protein
MRRRALDDAGPRSGFDPHPGSPGSLVIPEAPHAAPAPSEQP